jgi:hypothetical protein
MRTLVICFGGPRCSNPEHRVYISELRGSEHREKVEEAPETRGWRAVEQQHLADDASCTAPGILLTRIVLLTAR